MKYIIKDTPIRKNSKTYKVGDEFPYSEKDKKLLWNLEEVSEQSLSEVDKSKTEKPKEDQTKKVMIDKHPSTKKKVASKKTTNSKKK